MLGSRIKSVLAERGMTPKELSRRSAINSQTLYSILERDANKIDVDVLRNMCSVLEVPLEFMCGGDESETLSVEEHDLLRKYRALDDHGRSMVGLVAGAELERISSAQRESGAASRIIPLYATPAAAGYANPALGEDYEDYSVPADSRADFAARISGDSMEPYIADGSIVLVSRSMPISDGDVGLFFVDGDIKCKQYCEDSYGNVYRFSLIRARADADTEIPASSGITVFCFGKVLLPKRPPLPEN